MLKIIQALLVKVFIIFYKLKLFNLKGVLKKIIKQNLIMRMFIIYYF